MIPIGANMAVRRSVVRAIGGLRVDLGKLDGSLRTGEDHEFFLRMLHAGYRGVYEPTAIVYHRVGAERLDRWLFPPLAAPERPRRRAARSRVPARRVPRLLRAPRYLWRQAAADVASTMTAAARRDRAQRFGASGRLIWFAGLSAGSLVR